MQVVLSVEDSGFINQLRGATSEVSQRTQLKGKRDERQLMSIITGGGTHDVRIGSVAQANRIEGEINKIFIDKSKEVARFQQLTCTRDDG